MNLPAYQDKTASDAAIELPQFDNWIEATGYAVVATALGMGTNQESCSSSRIRTSIGSAQSESIMDYRENILFRL